MNYELSKKLYDAGFPFRDVTNDHCRDVDHVYWFVDGPRTPLYARPTLSELIEACGHKFVSLIIPDYVTGYGKYMANAMCPPNIGWGETPEEAVANLWLELNKKHV